MCADVDGGPLSCTLHSLHHSHTLSCAGACACAVVPEAIRTIEHGDIIDELLGQPQHQFHAKPPVAARAVLPLSIADATAAGLDTFEFNCEQFMMHGSGASALSSGVVTATPGAAAAIAAVAVAEPTANMKHQSEMQRYLEHTVFAAVHMLPARVKEVRRALHKSFKIKTSR